MAVSSCGWEGLCCRDEGEYSQRHVKESRVGREERNMASRLNWAVRGEGSGVWRERKERAPREGLKRTKRAKRAYAQDGKVI